MLDDDRLADLLARAGAGFEVPAAGRTDILARAAGTSAATADPEDTTGDGTAGPFGGDAVDELTPARRHRMRRLAEAAGRHRVRTAVAGVVVVLVVAGAVGALVRSTASTTPTLTQGLGHATRGPAPSVGRSATPTTASPQTGSAGGSTQQKSLPAPFSTNGSHAATGPAATTPSAPSLPSDAVGQSAKIEQTGTLGLTVRRGALNGTMSRLGNLAGASGGFVASSQTQSGANTGGAPSGSITLQVPVAAFSGVLKQAEALGATSGLATRATDVTGQYVDLQARIAALEDSRQQYLTILSKATTVGDVLSVQEQLDTIQSQIEQLQGQLAVLTSETSYSTLTVSVSEGTPTPPPVPVPESGLVRAWHDSVGGFLAGVEGVIRVAGPILFALLCLALVLLGGRALWRRYQRHNL